MDTNVIEALNGWAEVWSQTDLAGDLAEQLSCSEVEAIAKLLRLGGYAEEAATWISFHSAGDDEGDDHYVAPASEFEVPEDPMDQLQCDSCQ